MSGFAVEQIDSVLIDGPPELSVRELMSPYVWREPRDAGFHLMVRAVPADRTAEQDSGIIWYGRSGSSGLSFHMDAEPIIVPGGRDDAMGCEDPTVVRTDDGMVVYYTGVTRDGHGHMLYATGPDPHTLEKRGIALASRKSERNTKEATVQIADGTWRLFYEYAHDGHSLIGLADAEGPHGPWNEKPEPFLPRETTWDSWHLSTGPLLLDDPARPVMFYNGATQDAHWGIGWVELSPDLTRVVKRCGDPLIAPPIDVVERDIVFAASVVERDGIIWLYYSRNDRELMRATIRRV